MAAPLMFALFNGLPASAWFDAPDARAARRSTSARTTAILATGDCERRTRLDAEGQPLRRAHVLTTCACTSMRTATVASTATANPRARMTPRQLVRAAARRGVLLPPCACGVPAAAGDARRLPGARAGGRPALALLYPDANATRADPARARRQPRTHGLRGRAPAPGGHDLLASRRPIPWEKRTLFTSSRWTSTPASTY